MLKVRDLMRADTAQEVEAEAMSSCFCVVPAEADLADAARSILRHDSRRALVMDKGKLVGTLALTDALTRILTTSDDRAASP